MKRLETLALTVLTLMCGACDYYYYRIPSPDDLWHIIPWFDHMIQARYIHPYETQNVPRNTPAGTVPVSGGNRTGRRNGCRGTLPQPTRSGILLPPARSPARRGLAPR